MHRNLYDTDCSTWSPEGRVFQSEYACESVKQGSCAIGIRSNTHALLCGIRRSPGVLSSYNNKLSRVDDHIGVADSGIASDGKLIVNMMRSQAMGHEYVFEEKVPVMKLIHSLSSKSQKLNISASKRPFGVGCLVASAHPDSGDIKLIETSPTGDFIEYYAQAFGSRCQSANTYLESHLDDFKSASREELILHGLRALRRSLPPDAKMDVSSVQVGVVSPSEPFEIISEEILKPLVDLVMAETLRLVEEEEVEPTSIPVPEEVEGEIVLPEEQ